MKTSSKFIIVKHEAERAGAHFDLRFKMPDSSNWASFATKKEIPLEKGNKIMIVRTHNHSEKEALYLGKIESGYGKGILKKWDSGSCIVLKYTSRSMAIEFKGSKLKGIYHIISTGVMDRNFKRPTFLFFKGSIKYKEEE